jgi:cysteinyl-tRNA synthetase
MPLKIFNTISRKKEVFKTLEPGKVRMYVCGPTVYNKAHVGHAMSALVFDIIRRYLEYRDYHVKYAMNFTDVDDKIIQRANELGTDSFELAKGYIDDFNQNLKDLNIKPPDIQPRASLEMEKIIEMVGQLVEKGLAYPLDGDVYFRVRKDENYGRLSGRNVDNMQSGTRIGVDDRKEDPLDFALWKKAKPGEPAWESPWGQGRPGWHIECSAMNLNHLGEQIDIHGGGNDLIFPHHENEIAQTESLTGKPFATYWVHNGMLQLGGEKMSKSLGNLVSIDDFLKDYSPDVLRIMVLNSAYRNPLTFNSETIENANKMLERIQSGLRASLPNAEGLSENGLEIVHKQMQATQTGFEESMDDDFNAAGALGYLFELVRVINQSRDSGASEKELKPPRDLLCKLTSVLGLQLVNREMMRDDPVEPFIELLIDLRAELRSQKLFQIADQIRERLDSLGVMLEDSKGGTSWRWK